MNLVWTQKELDRALEIGKEAMSALREVAADIRTFDGCVSKDTGDKVIAILKKADEFDADLEKE
jgi:hypothetical protein